MARGSKPGERRGGRKPGTPNKVTATVREAMEQVFDGLGGAEAMLEWAKGNRGEFYKLWMRLLPVQINAQVQGRLTLEQLVNGEAPPA
jgi:hypothetical protein